MLIVRQPPGCEAERAYIASVILREFLGVPFRTEAGTDRDHLVIVSAENPAGPSLRIDDSFFRAASTRWLDPASMPVLPLELWNTDGVVPREALVEAVLPVLYGHPVRSGVWFEATDDGARLGLDVFGSAFFQLTRYEEVVNRTRDRLDRFPAAEAVAFRANFALRPLIDEYVAVLRAALTRLWPRLVYARRGYSFRLTHDVDLPWVVARRGAPEIVRSMGADLLRRRDPGLILRRLGAAMKGGEAAMDADPANTFDWIMSRSEALGLASEFYFICGHTSPEDGNYTLDDPWIRKLLGSIHARGHRIGLHPSLGTYRDPGRLAAQYATLRRACSELGIEQDSWGGRQHYLMWSNPETWRNWDAAGLDFDSSMTFAESVGFRSGVCREYPVFDLGRRVPLRLRERPLILMEGTLLDYMAADHPAALAWAERLAAACRRVSGEFVLLWHNNVLAGRRERRLYLDMLAAGSAGRLTG